MDINLTGKHALVGGASRGIGAASAQVMASLGASITGVSRNLESLQAARQSWDTSKGQQHQVLAADYDHPESLRELMEGRFDENPVHILVNNTGGPPDGPAHTASLEEYRIAFNRHLICNQVLLQAVLPGMRAAGYGRVINIISTSVKQPIPGLGVSNSIRGAVANWAKTIAGELGPDNITVNNVLPGFTDTDRLDEIVGNAQARSGDDSEQVRARMMTTVPLRRFAQASETANAIAFLASPAASYISGINLPVDGGRTASL